jgi:hypothetical protein
LKNHPSRIYWIIVCPFLKVAGMTLFPFILLQKPNPSEILLNHERIHLRQQIELLIFPFYVLYLLEYLFNRFRGQNHHQAYRNISFEKEAYNNEEKLNYLANRKAWSYWRNV